jgi:hypothetical protein
VPDRRGRAGLTRQPDVAANIAHYLTGSPGGLYLRDISYSAVQRAVAAVKAIPNIHDVSR